MKGEEEEEEEEEGDLAELMDEAFGAFSEVVCARRALRDTALGAAVGGLSVSFSLSLSVCLSVCLSVSRSLARTCIVVSPSSYSFVHAISLSIHIHVIILSFYPRTRDHTHPDTRRQSA